MLSRSILSLLILGSLIGACDKESRHSTPPPAKPPVAVVDKALVIETEQTTTLVDRGGSVSIELAVTGTADDASLLWSFTGDFPVDLALQGNGRKARLQGQIGQPQRYDFTVHVKDQKNHSASLPLTVYVRTRPFGISTLLLTNAKEQKPYQVEINATGGDDRGYSWSLVKTARNPDWLKTEVKAGKFLLSGTPLVPGLYDVRVAVRDASGTVVNKDFVLAVDSVLTLTANPVVGVVDRAFELPLDITGGLGKGFTLSVVEGVLPAGLSLDSKPQNNRAFITGTPTQSVPVRLKIQAVDALNGLATQVLEFTIEPKIGLVTPFFADGKMGSPYNATIRATGSIEKEYIWNVRAANANGLAARYENGKPELTISGKPLTSNEYSIWEISVADAKGVKATETFYIRISITPPTIKTKELIGEMDMEKEQAILIEGSSVFASGLRWSLAKGALPTGLFLQPDASGSSVSLVGKPFIPGTYNFTLRLTDQEASGEQTFTLKVKAAAPQFAILSRNLQRSQVDTYYNTRIEVKNGSLKDWTVAEGELPAGLTLEKRDDQSLKLSGSPEKKGFYSFTVTAESESGARSNARYHLAVDPPRHWFAANAKDTEALIDNLDLSHRIVLDTDQKLIEWRSSSPDQRWYFYRLGPYNGDNSFTLIDLENPESSSQILLSHAESVTAVWSPNGQYLALTYRLPNADPTYLQIYDLLNKKVEKSQTPVGHSSLAFSADGKNLAYCSDLQTLVVEDLSTSPSKAYSSPVRERCTVTGFAPYENYLLNGETLLRLKNRLVEREGKMPGWIVGREIPRYLGRYPLRMDFDKNVLLALNAATIEPFAVLASQEQGMLSLSPNENDLVSALYIANGENRWKIAKANDPDLKFQDLGLIISWPDASQWSRDGENFLVKKSDGYYEYDASTLKASKVLGVAETPQYTFQQKANDRSLIYFKAAADKKQLVIQPLADPGAALRVWDLDKDAWDKPYLDPSSPFLRIYARTVLFLNYGKPDASLETLDTYRFADFLL